MNSTLEEAKKYTDSQRLGYAENIVISLNVDKIEADSILTKVSDMPIKVTSENLVSVTLVAPSGTTTIPGNGLMVVSKQDGVTAITVQEAPDDWFVLVVDEEVTFDDYFTTGVWFMTDMNDNDGAVYISDIIVNTVHQIDQKFIPGMFLPVVELTTPFWDHDDADWEMTEKENAQLSAAANTGLPAVIRFLSRSGKDPGEYVDIPTSAVAMFVAAPGQGEMYFIDYNGLPVMIMEHDGAWTWFTPVTPET